MNCVEFEELLAREAQSGLKIPSGQFILKPVLHAGKVGLSSAINGTVIDNSTSKPIVGGTTVVALKQKVNSGLDRVVMSFAS